MAKKGRSASTSKNLERENAELRQKLEQQANTTQSLVSQLATISPKSIHAADLMVGIRNISDNTIGIHPVFPGDVALSLNGATGVYEPGQTAVVSYAWWQQIRRGPLVANGMILRDDTVLGDSYNAAPGDRAMDLPANWQVNAIEDPHVWITSRNEMQIRQDMAKITAVQGIRRLQRAVNDKIRELRTLYADDPDRDRRALDELPAIYGLVDQLTQQRL